jgi:hypothetical protein
MNKFVKAVSLLMLSAVALVGCASLAVDKASVNDTTITLTSKDVETVGVKMGYTEKTKESIPVSDVPKYAEYPQAAVRTFKVTTKEKEVREAIFIASQVTIKKYELKQSLRAKGGMVMESNQGTFDTYDAAKKKFDQLIRDGKAGKSGGFVEIKGVSSLEIVTYDNSERYRYFGFKPLQK